MLYYLLTCFFYDRRHVVSAAHRGDYGLVEGARRHAEGSLFACFASTKVPILTPVELQELSGFANAAHQHAEGLLLQV